MFLLLRGESEQKNGAQTPAVWYTVGQKTEGRYACMAMELVWLGQGGFLIRCGGASICLDPYLSDSCERSGGHTRIAPAPLDPASIDADVFVINHDHMDHLDEGTLRKVDLSAHLFAAPATCRKHLRALGVPEDRLLPFDRGDHFGIGDAELYAVFADHTEDSIGLIVRAGGQTAYFTADTLYNPRLQAEAAPFAPDILVPCINGRWGNMGAEEAAQLAKSLGVALAIPTHYGMFAENTADPMDFVRAMGGKGCRILTQYEPTILNTKGNP